MTPGYVVRGLVQSLGAHFIVSTLLSLAVIVVWRRVAAAPAPAARSARRLFVLRLLPPAGGLATATLVAIGYLLWEPHRDHESVGPLALAAAAAGLGVAAKAASGLLLALACTARIRRELMAAGRGTLPTEPLAASVIEAAFPVVAIVGFARPRLFVARSVVDACSPEELDAVLAHEQAHARQHDNLRHLAIAAAPDLFGLCPGGRRLEADWRQAAEFAADESAAARRDGGLHLAAALIKVARLATSPPTPAPASALYQGGPIADRVRRLLDPPPTGDELRWSTWARASTLGAAVAAAVAVMPVLHLVAELLLGLGR